MAIENVEIEFTESEAVMQKYRTVTDWSLEDEHEVVNAYFLVPVRFRVANSDLYGWTGKQGGAHNTSTVPILLPGFRTLESVRECRQYDGPVGLDPWESGEWAITLRRDGERIVAKSRGTRQSGAAEFAAWERACFEYQKKVRDYLLREFPALIRHPDLGSWFRGEVDLPETWA